MLGIRHQLLRRFGNISCVLLGTHPSYGMDELSDKSIQLPDKSKQSLVDRGFPRLHASSGEQARGTDSWWSLTEVGPETSMFIPESWHASSVV